MLKQNRFISIISIMGTAVAITMIMTIIVSAEIKNIDLAPESNRSRTLYIGGQTIRDTIKGRVLNGSVSYNTIHEHLPHLKKPLKKAVVSGFQKDVSSVLNMEGSQKLITGFLRITNADYWDIMEFNFLQGRPYTEEEVFSGVQYAVLSENIARQLFEDSSPLNKKIEINFQLYQIIGIVKDVSPLFNDAYGDVWVPYTSNKEYKHQHYEILIMGRDEKDFPELITEVRKYEEQYAREKAPEQLYLRGPENRRIHSMNVWGSSVNELEDEIKAQNRKRVFIMCVLLLIPAINLSGISLSRIKKRTAEIGVRKAFGAKKYIILTQVLYENFITSVIGGILGLIISYIVVFWMREWLLGIPANSPIPIATLVSPVVFIAVCLACIVINLLSAGLPAYKASQTTIINSLHQNDKKS